MIVFHIHWGTGEQDDHDICRNSDREEPAVWEDIVGGNMMIDIACHLDKGKILDFWATEE
jgi:hypothetical protein